MHPGQQSGCRRRCILSSGVLGVLSEVSTWSRGHTSVFCHSGSVLLFTSTLAHHARSKDLLGTRQLEVRADPTEV